MKSPGNALEKSAAPPRARILDSARELFYSRGIKGVSVDEIAAAADTNKMTLYRHFQSKDLLITEYVRMLAAESDAMWDEIANDHPKDAAAQLRDWVERIGEKLSEPGGRGCAVANAAVEIPEKDHPARAIIEEHKTHQRDMLLKLCKAGGFSQPEQLADELFLLLEGARINLQSVGPCGPGARFRDMALGLIRSRATKKTHHGRA
jgi:AcrR family transcriptional regulator